MSALVKLYYKIRRKPAPPFAEHPLWLLLWKPVRKFLNVVVIPSVPYNCVRIGLYRLIGFRIGRHVFIGMRCYLDDMDPGKTVIEDNVTVSYGCFFAIHGIHQEHTSIVIREGAYIGMRANILSGKTGITVGRGSIIGAGALVRESTPDFSTCVGVPARVIKIGSEEDQEPQ